MIFSEVADWLDASSIDVQQSDLLLLMKIDDMIVEPLAFNKQHL